MWSRRLIVTLALIFSARANATSPVIWGSPFASNLQSGLIFKKSDTSTTCNAAAAGSLRKNVDTLEACNGTAWASLNAAGAASVGSFTGTDGVTASSTTGAITVGLSTASIVAMRIKGSSAGTLSIGVPATVTAHTVLFPGSQGAASTYLQNDGSGNLTWATVSASAGVSSIAAGRNVTASGSTGAVTIGNVAAWGIQAAFTGANPTMGTASVGSFTIISDAALTLTPGTLSDPVGMACAGTSAAATPTTSASTCPGAGVESVGIAFGLPPSPGWFEVCMSFPHQINVNQSSSMNAVFTLVETATNNTAIVTSNSFQPESGFGPNAISTASIGVTTWVVDNPIRVCGMFNWSSYTATQVVAVRLMYQESPSGVINQSRLMADGAVGRNIGVSVKRLP